MVELVAAVVEVVVVARGRSGEGAAMDTEAPNG